MVQRRRMRIPLHGPPEGFLGPGCVAPVQLKHPALHQTGRLVGVVPQLRSQFPARGRVGVQIPPQHPSRLHTHRPRGIG